MRGKTAPKLLQLQRSWTYIKHQYTEGVKLLITPHEMRGKIATKPQQLQRSWTYIKHQYTKGVKLLITPHEMRGKEASQYLNSNGVELYAIKSIIGLNAKCRKKQPLQYTNNTFKNW